MTRAINIGLLLLGASACGLGGAQVPPDNVAHTASTSLTTPLVAQGALYVPGEWMRFEVSLHDVVGAEAIIAVGQPGRIEGRNAIIVRSKVRSTGVVAMVKTVRDQVTTTVALDTGTPILHEADIVYGDKHMRVHTSFANGGPGAFELELTRNDLPPRRVQQVLPAGQPAFDTHSVMGAVRGWRAQPGDHAYFYVMAGRHIWETTVRMAGIERLETEQELVRAIRIDGVTRSMTPSLSPMPRKPPRAFSVWLSADELRKPLLSVMTTKYGTVKARMVEYQVMEPAIARR